MSKKVLSALRLQLVPILEGPPGVGKTSFARHLGMTENLRVFVVCLSHKMDTEVHGQPVISQRRFQHEGHDLTMIEQAPPRYVVEALDSTKSGQYKGALIVYDEFTTISNQSQAPTLAILADSIVGEVGLPREHIGMMACTNPPQMAAGGFPITPPAANRFIHLKYEYSPNEFSECFAGYWDNPPVIERWGTRLDESVWSAERAKIGAYIRTMPTELIKLPEEASLRSGAWPSPRTWDFASRIMAAHVAGDVSETDAAELVCGAVGSAHAAQFFTWREKADLADPRELLDNPKSFKVPHGRSDILFYILTGCAAEAKNRKNKFEDSLRATKIKPKTQEVDALKTNAVKAWLACWQILDTVIEQGGAKDLVAVTANMLARPEAHIKGAPIPDTVIKVAPILEAAGLDWSRNNKK